MTEDAPLAADGTWRCPRCAADRPDDDGFCGRCGAPRPAGNEAPTASGEPAATVGGEPAATREGLPISRAVILNGIILGAVLVAVLLGRGSGPGPIRFEPARWRCDGAERAWLATIPASSLELRIEWRRGGPEGELLHAGAATRADLDRFAAPDGSLRVTSTETDAADAPECGLSPGTYTLALRDGASGRLLASGDVELAAP